MIRKCTWLEAPALPSWKHQFPQDHCEVKQLGPTWKSDHFSVEVSAVVKNTIKISEWRNGAGLPCILLGQTKVFKDGVYRGKYVEFMCWGTVRV